MLILEKSAIILYIYIFYDASFKHLINMIVFAYQFTKIIFLHYIILHFTIRTICIKYHFLHEIYNYKLRRNFFHFFAYLKS